MAGGDLYTGGSELTFCIRLSATASVPEIGLRPPPTLTRVNETRVLADRPLTVC